ncbi:MAG: TonB-dependent receptor plug domain-containing protein [Candidatus Krumholzibacteria bacterium]|nr:TonB-dependent receptor plug domain-containing protein [Candidatus Krumholzibacteria bacterium]
MNLRSINPAVTGIFCAFLVLLLFFPAHVDAAKKGRLSGTVIDLITKKPVSGAIVAIQGTTISVLTGKNGKFKFDLPPGKVSLSVYCQEYFTTNYQDIEIFSGRITPVVCEMVCGIPEQNMFFSIGGITVIDKLELIPEEIETTHSISSAEIEHHLATNLGDILDIIPGVERTAPPGLAQKNQVALRGVGDVGTSNNDLALLGTKVLIDDITLSNNANLQSGTGTSYGGLDGTTTTAGSGIDLRTIPADNIESVEVVTGVPSVEYGDLTSGLIKVTTKSGRQPTRLKIKSNPDTKEGSLSGGIILGDAGIFSGTGISYTANMAYSERDIRREGDEYFRYNGQITFRSELFDKRLKLLNKFYYTGVFDEINADPEDALSIEQSNKDKTYLYGQTVTYKPIDDLKIEWRANIRYTKRDSYSQKLTGADTRILTDEMEDGTYPGIFGAGAYLSQIWTKGEEWTAGGKLNLRYDFGLMDYDHSILAGAQYTFDDNVGEGKVFDPLFPPYGDSGRRPLSYDAVPALHTASLYLEDKINGTFRFRPWALNVGFRYEMYTPEELNLAGLFNDEGVVKSRNGTYLNPRIRFKYEPFDDTQIRLSWGKSSKMSPMTKIFQGPMYIDIVEENITPPDSMPLIAVHVFNYDNSTLMGYQNEKAEASIDRKFGPLGIILTGYYTHSKDMPRAINSPLILHRYSWDDYPNIESRTPIDTIYTTTGSRFGHYNGVGWYKNYGLEFQLITKRIKRISTVFRVSGSYYKSFSGAEGTYISGPVPNDELGGKTIYPIYNHAEQWRQKMIVNYSADWFIKRLGMWLTFSVQQTLLDHKLNVVNPDPYAVAYIDPLSGRTIQLTPAEAELYGLERTYDDLALRVRKIPNDRLLFNINISKSLGSGTEVSMFVHNVFDDPAYYLNDYDNWDSRNHEIFYGIEFSMILDNLFGRITGRDSGGEVGG